MAESIQNLENSITNLSKQVDAGRAAINEQAATISHVSTILNDTVMTLVNSKRVGEDGKVGAVALANDLANAPIGDAGKLRNNLGLSAAATLPVKDTGNWNEIGWGADELMSVGSGASIREGSKGYTDSKVSAVKPSRGWNENGFWCIQPGGLQTCFQHVDGKNLAPAGLRWVFPRGFAADNSFTVNVTVEYKNTWTQHPVMITGRDWSGVTIFMGDIGGNMADYRLHMTATGFFDY